MDGWANGPLQGLRDNPAFTEYLTGRDAGVEDGTEPAQAKAPSNTIGHHKGD